MSRLLLSLVLLGAVLATACAPESIIRRSAFIPGASAPSRTGYQLDKGAVRVEAQMNAIRAGDLADVDDAFTEVGDPGVFIPDFHVGGSFYFGLPFGLEIGAQGVYASGRWSEKNTAGVLPFPDGQEPDFFMAGPGIRYNFKMADKRLNLAILSEFNIVSVPEAIFVCEDPSGCDDERSISLERAIEVYRLDRIEREVFILPNIGFQGGFLVDPHVYLYGMLGAQASVTNVGFDDDLSSLPDHTMETFWMGYVGAGVDFRIDAFVVGGSFYYPFETVDRIDFGPSFAVKIGAVFGGSPEVVPAPRERYYEEDPRDYYPPVDAPPERYDDRGPYR